MLFSLFRRKSRKTPAPSIDVGVFEDVLASGDDEACRALAEQLATFVSRPDTKAEERALVMPVLVRLACHRQRALRADLAKRLVNAPWLAPDVIFAIAADEDPIALPFLRAARAIGPIEQLAVFRAGNKARRLAVCARSDVCPEVVREVVERGERSMLLACIANDNAVFPPDLARQVYVRFRDDEEVIAALLERADLPLEVRIAHVEIVSGRLRQVMARAEWQVARRAVEAATTMEEKALVEILADAGDAEQLTGAFEFLARRGRLTAAVLLRAACAGHVAVLLHALAWLARLRPERLATALRPGASLAVLRAACARSGLPKNAHALILGIILAARREGEMAANVGKRIAGFGPLVLETLAVTDALSVSDKMQAASMLQQVGDEQTRELATRFLQSLLRHAA